MAIRKMQGGDVQAVSHMVVDAFRDSVAATLSRQGISTFMQIAAPEAFAERLSGANRMWVDDSGGEIRGMIEIREGRHVAMLFVAPRWQRTGVGRALVEEALRHCSGASVTVKASLTSVGAYRRYGFEPDGPEAEQEGLRYRPLRKRLPSLPAPAATTAD